MPTHMLCSCSMTTWWSDAKGEPLYHPQQIARHNVPTSKMYNVCNGQIECHSEEKHEQNVTFDLTACPRPECLSPHPPFYGLLAGLLVQTRPTTMYYAWTGTGRLKQSRRCISIAISFLVVVVSVAKDTLCCYGQPTYIGPKSKTETGCRNPFHRCVERYLV